MLLIALIINTTFSDGWQAISQKKLTTPDGDYGYEPLSVCIGLAAGEIPVTRALPSG